MALKLSGLEAWMGVDWMSDQLDFPTWTRCDTQLLQKTRKDDDMLLCRSKSRKTGSHDAN